MKKKYNDDINDITDFKIDSSYYTKLILLVLLFIITFSICLIFASKTLEREKAKPISYNQKSNISYKVYLNDNEFYEHEYLDMNKAYIASLIKYINVNYDYKFNIKEKSTLDFDYQILGDLIIENNNGTRKYFEKTYNILDSKHQKLENDRSLSINENVQIDYDYYNKLANSFRNKYGVDTNSYLNVYLDVKAKSDDKLNYKINEDNKVILKIPLSEKAIEINIDADNNDVTKLISPIGKVVLNQKYLIVEIVLFIMSVIFFLIFMKQLAKKFKKITYYDKYVNNLLKEYDRLIVETKTKLVMTKYNIIEVKSFTELLDVRDNLKEPIIYYNVIEHIEGIFYIKSDDDIYLLTVKNKDLEN